MSKFEKATRKKLRFQAPVGLITTEDLWDLTLPQLNSIAKDLNKKIKASEEEDFLDEPKAGVEEDTTKLAFDVVLFILETKKKEKEDREQATERKQKKDQLLALLAEKQTAGLRELSEEELKKKIEEL